MTGYVGMLLLSHIKINKNATFCYHVKINDCSKVLTLIGLGQNLMVQTPCHKVIISTKGDTKHSPLLVISYWTAILSEVDIFLLVTNTLTTHPPNRHFIVGIQ